MSTIEIIGVSLFVTAVWLGPALVVHYHYQQVLTAYLANLRRDQDKAAKRVVQERVSVAAWIEHVAVTAPQTDLRTIAQAVEKGAHSGWVYP